MAAKDSNAVAAFELGFQTRWVKAAVQIVTYDRHLMAVSGHCLKGQL
jgi:hypothetical protein